MAPCILDFGTGGEQSASWNQEKYKTRTQRYTWKQWLTIINNENYFEILCFIIVDLVLRKWGGKWSVCGEKTTDRQL